MLMSSNCILLTCLNERIISSYTLFIGLFMFQHKLQQSTTMYSNHRNGSRVGYSGCSDRDESLAMILMMLLIMLW